MVSSGSGGSSSRIEARFTLLESLGSIFLGISDISFILASSISADCSI